MDIQVIDQTQILSAAQNSFGCENRSLYYTVFFNYAHCVLRTGWRKTTNSRRTNNKTDNTRKKDLVDFYKQNCNVFHTNKWFFLHISCKKSPNILLSKGIACDRIENAMSNPQAIRGCNTRTHSLIFLRSVFRTTARLSTFFETVNRYLFMGKLFFATRKRKQDVGMTRGCGNCVRGKRYTFFNTLYGKSFPFCLHASFYDFSTTV